MHTHFCWSILLFSLSISIYILFCVIHAYLHDDSFPIRKWVGCLLALEGALTVALMICQCLLLITSSITHLHSPFMSHTHTQTYTLPVWSSYKTDNVWLYCVSWFQIYWTFCIQVHIRHQVINLISYLRREFHNIFRVCLCGQGFQFIRFFGILKPR